MCEHCEHFALLFKNPGGSGPDLEFAMGRFWVPGGGGGQDTLMAPPSENLASKEKSSSPDKQKRL